MNNKKTIILSFILAFTYLGVLAQPKDNSPYSRFGLGDPVDNNFVFLRTTGLSGAYYDPYQINIVNPASNGYLKSTVFDLGLYSKYSRLSTSSNSSNVWSGNIEYLSFGFPLINPINDILEKKVRKFDVGLSFTLMPHSVVGFDIKSEKEDPEIGNIYRSYKGAGGTYKFLSGIGVRYEDFAFGFNVGYFFGKINYDRNLVFTDLDYSYANEYHRDFAVNGFLYNVGLIYNLVLNKAQMSEKNNLKAQKIVFGIYGNSKTSFNSYGSAYNKNTILALGPTNSELDTVFHSDEIVGNGTLPMNLGGSIIFNNKNKMIVGVNYSQTLWNQYTNDVKDEDLLNSYDVSLGMQYTPNENSYTSYFDRINYRSGIYYKTDPRSEDGEQFSEKGIRIGLGLPFVFKRKISRMNVDLNFGQRGGNLSISENFVKLSFSITFNDTEWFVKRKYY